MKFKTIAEAFNHYRTSTLEEIERRAAEIKNIVATDATADVDAPRGGRGYDLRAPRKL